ncbi:hypothetical protein ACLKA6_007155 [Drosophila palustris]
MVPLLANMDAKDFDLICQFTEDGSFIGQYVPGKLQPPVSPQPVNNTAASHQQQQQQQQLAAGGAAVGGGAAAVGGAGGSSNSSSGGGGATATANTAAVATYV